MSVDEKGDGTLEHNRAREEDEVEGACFWILFFLGSLDATRAALFLADSQTGLAPGERVTAAV